MKTRLSHLFLCIGVLLTLRLGLPAAAQASASDTASETFPILTRFELVHDYGYFLGDKIPLTLIVEANPGVVLDLVNLPKKGEKHGLFEIRNMHLTSSAGTGGAKIYRAQYTLQYFGVTPLTVPFEPLDILYALSKEGDVAAHPYQYKSLRTQPVMVNVTRIGPYRPTQPMDIKGPRTDARRGYIWGSVGLGSLLLCTALGSWGWQWYQRHWQAQPVETSCDTPALRTLAILRQEGAILNPPPTTSPPNAERLSEIIRQHLSTVLDVPLRSLTSSELAPLLVHQALGQELLQLLQRCEALKYQEPTWLQNEERQLWWEAFTLFEKLQEGARA
jgi:hypothetical protein